METKNHDVIFSGTKDVAENLKFDESKLQEFFQSHGFYPQAILVV